MLKVNYRGGFSDRNEINPINIEIQLKDFDERTRIRLSNLVNKIYNDAFYGQNFYEASKQGFLYFVIDKIYAQPIEVDEIHIEKEVLSFVHETIMNDTYDAVLTVVEAIARYIDVYLSNRAGQQYIQEIGCVRVFHRLNNFFEAEYVGYRFIDGIISPISDELEVNAVNEVLHNPFESVRDHISKANKFLADRENPDYENSIKESISAVEAVCQEYLKVHGKDATLGNMLKKLESNGLKIHSSMKDAFNKLYGYTSDANGIRHAGNIGGPLSTFEEAKFMLVSCSAFINYLIGASTNLSKMM